jgi:hypothetical protein
MKYKILLGYAVPMFCGLAFGNCCNLSADQRPAPKTGFDSDSPIAECSKEFLISYFPASIVGPALEKFNLPKDKLASITKDLSETEKSIISQVEEKASKITPNPLKDPQQRQVAVKIFRETLLEIFTGVLNKNGVTDGKQIQAMLEEIQQQKAKKFADCLDKHKPQPAEVQPPVEQKAANLQADAEVQTSTKTSVQQTKVKDPDLDHYDSYHHNQDNHHDDEDDLHFEEHHGHGYNENNDDE